MTKSSQNRPKAQSQAQPQQQGKKQRPRAAKRFSDEFSANDIDKLREIWSPGDQSSLGYNVDTNFALTFSAYYRAITLIAASMAIMPIKIYRKIKEGDKVVGREEVGDHPANDIVGWSPDAGETTSYMWRETMTAHACSVGNGVSEIVRNNRGQAMLAYVLNPNKVTFERNPQTGKRQYKLMEAKEKILTPSQVLHVPALSWDGWVGKAPLRLARETILLGKTTEKFGMSFFEKGARPMGFLTKPNNLNEKQRQNLRQEWKELHEGLKNFLNVGILSGGLDWKDVGISPEEAQFLLTRKFQVEEICRWFGIPPHMMANMENAKFNNVEQTLIEFMTFTLFPWIKRWEGELNLKLFTPKEAFTYYAEFNFEALLRVDLQTKMKAIELDLKTGRKTIDETRMLDNLNPYPNGLGSHPLVAANNMARLQDVVDGKTLNSGLTKGKDSANIPSNAGSKLVISDLMASVAAMDRQALEDLRDILDILIRGKTRELVDAERGA